MKSRLFGCLFVAAFSLCCMQGCGDETTQPQDQNPKTLEELIAGTPKLNEEAELAALWLSQELVAFDTLYEQMVQFLRVLRQNYAAEVGCLDSISFWHSWSNRMIGVYLDIEARSRFVHGEFHDADSLNALFRGTVLDSESDTTVPWFYVVYQFTGRLNLDSIASYYRELPGVTYVSPSWVQRMDGSNLYPGRDPEGRLTFLLSDAWGDCPSGCIYRHFWYFKFDGDSVTLIGDFLSDFEHDLPDWWNEAKVSFYRFIQGPQGPRGRLSQF